MHSHVRTKENKGKFARSPGRDSIRAPPEYKNTRLSVLALTIINRSTKISRQCTTFENSESEEVCVVWNSFYVVICVLSAWDCVNALEGVWQIWVGINMQDCLLLTYREKTFCVFLLHVLIKWEFHESFSAEACRVVYSTSARDMYRRCAAMFEPHLT